MSVSASTPLMDTDRVKWTGPLISSVLVACLSGIQYGFHMSEFNAPGSDIKLELLLTDTQLGFATSIFSLGGILGSTTASLVSSKRGLKLGFIITSVCYVLGSLIECRAFDYPTLLSGRFISGVGGGLAIVYMPLYVNDIAHVSTRGILGSLTQVSVNLGILVTQLLALYYGGSKWRKVISFGWVIGLISLFAIFLGLFVESPKWLILNGNKQFEDQGRDILRKLRGFSDVEDEIEIWKQEQTQHLKLLEAKPHLKNIGFWYYLTDSNYFNSRNIATFMMLGQQFSGINSVIFYGVDILNKVFPEYSMLINIFISLGNMIITSIASLFLDRMGRKPLLSISLLFMTISSLGLSAGILFDKTLLAVLSIFMYVGSFAVGCGPIPFLIVSEVSQIEVKDVAQSWSTDCNWFSVFVIGIIFPFLSKLFGSAGWVYILFAIVSSVFAIWVKRFVPETMGKSTYSEIWGTRVE